MRLISISSRVFFVSRRSSLGHVEDDQLSDHSAVLFLARSFHAHPLACSRWPGNWFSCFPQLKMRSPVRRLNCEGPIVECATQRRLIRVNSSAPTKAEAEKSSDKRQIWNILIGQGRVKIVVWFADAHWEKLNCFTLIHKMTPIRSNPKASRAIKSAIKRTQCAVNFFSLSQAAISLMHKRCSPDHLKWKLKIIKKIIVFVICFNDFQLQTDWKSEIGCLSCKANCSRARVSFRNRMFIASFLFGSRTRYLALIGVFAVDRRSTITDRDARKYFHARNKSTIRHVIVSCTLSIHDIIGWSYTILAQLIKSETATQIYV